ncbi:MAG: glycosyltransferase, partial [Acetobacteraceae bacterium]
MPNGFSEADHQASRLARRRRSPTETGTIRIGYASGSRTHQRDFAQAAPALARVLRERPSCRLVLFRANDSKEPVVNPDEFECLERVRAQIEWRDLVSIEELPAELARFDINLAPLEPGNPFCEAKSELKFFEAALVEVCTVASPTGPMRRVIRHGENGMLADSESEWYRALTDLVDDPPRRQRLAHAAYLEVLWPFSPARRAELIRSVLGQLNGGAEAARGFELELRRSDGNARTGGGPQAISLPDTELIFAADQLEAAEATVIIPLYNYADFVIEALESVRAQTVSPLDLIVVDDASTDRSLQAAADWARAHANRFNRIAVLRNRANAGVAMTRNAGFDTAETPYVLPLDADNRLLPRCVEVCLAAIKRSKGAFAYPAIRCFGGSEEVRGDLPFVPMRLAGGNYIDAMALVAKWAWAAVGGYQ